MLGEEGRGRLKQTEGAAEKRQRRDKVGLCSRINLQQDEASAGGRCGVAGQYGRREQQRERQEEEQYPAPPVVEDGDARDDHHGAGVREGRQDEEDPPERGERRHAQVPSVAEDGVKGLLRPAHLRASGISPRVNGRAARRRAWARAFAAPEAAASR